MNLSRTILAAMFLMGCISTSHALDVSLGVNTWYLAWQPSFEENFRGEGNGITAADPINNGPAYNDRWETQPGFMFGPVVNLRFSDQWSLGFVLLFSQEFDVESSYNVDAPAYTNDARYELVFRRYDGDLTINFRVGFGFGLFGGIKYLHWKGSGTYDITTSPDVYTSHTDIDIDGWATGPALGLSFARPIVGMLFFTASASGLLMKSRQEDRVVSSDSLLSYSDNTTEKKYWSRGFNGMAGFGYYLASMRSTIILGGRYQYLRNEDDPRDIFYGVTVTAMYTF